MKRFFNTKTTGFVVVLSCMFLALSCVNNDYELSEDRVNTDVTIFQEGLTLPLGTTAPIKMGDLYGMLDPELQEIIQNKDGKYGFSYAGNIDLTDTLAFVKEMFAIDALSFKESFAFNLSNVDLSSVVIDGQKIGVDGLDISGMINMPDINSKLPKLNENLQGASITLPKLNKSEMNLDLSSAIGNVKHEVPVISFGEDFSVPSQIKDMPQYYNMEVLYGDLQSNKILSQLGVKLPDLEKTYAFDEYSVNVPVKITLPKEIQSVESIRLHEDARFEMILEIVNPYFTAGSLTPHLLINLHDLFHVDKIMSGMQDEGYMDHDGINHHIHDNFVMSDENDWKADHIYHIESLAFNDWKKDAATGCLTLDKEIEITLSGNLELDLDNVKTTLRLLDERSKEPMGLKVDIKFFDFAVDDVVMNIAPITMSQNLEMPFNVSGIQLPELVKSVDYVEFDENSPLTVNMSANVPALCKDMNMSVKTLAIEFPAGIEIDHNASADAGEYNSATRTLTYKNINLAEGLNEAIRIKKLNFPGGNPNYSGTVKVTADAEGSGVLSSKDLLNQSDAKVDLNVNVSYAPKLVDYSVTIDDYSYEVKVDPVKFSESIPEAIGKMSKVLVYLDNSPVIKMNFDYPSTIDALSIVADKAKGLKIFFPSMLKFKSLDPAYNYDASTNSICFNKGQKIPSVVELPVDRLEIVPVHKEGSGYYIEGEMKVEGGVCLEGAVITKSVVDALKNEKASVSFSAVIPDLKPSALALDQYVATISESMDFEIPVIEGIPDMIEIKGVEAFELDDVYLNFSVDASSVVKLLGGVQMTMDFDVQLPSIIKMENAGAGNVFKIKGQLNEENKFVLDPIHIIGFDLTGFDFSSGVIDLGKQTVSIDGGITLNNLSVDLAELEGANLSVAVEGSLATKGTDLLKLGKIMAKVDCQFEINESLDLSSLSSQLGDKLNFMMDFNRFHFDLDLKTNISLPVQLSELKAVPYKGGVAGTPLQIDEPVALNTSANGEVTHSKIRISNLESDKHDDPEYQHIVLDLLSLVKDIPDSIQLHMSAGTKENAKFSIEPSVDYVLAADYALELPLELGEDFLIEFADTLRGLPSVLQDVLAVGSLGLSGEVTNSFPLTLDLEFQLLDVDGNAVPMSEGAGHQTIKAGNLDGSAVKTPLNVVLGVQKGVSIPQIDAVKLIFRATSSGAGFAEDNFIQVQLNALIPEGLSVNIKDLMGSSESKTEEIQ